MPKNSDGACAIAGSSGKILTESGPHAHLSEPFTFWRRKAQPPNSRNRTSQHYTLPLSLAPLSHCPTHHHQKCSPAQFLDRLLLPHSSSVWEGCVPTRRFRFHPRLRPPNRLKDLEVLRPEWRALLDSTRLFLRVLLLRRGAVESRPGTSTVRTLLESRSSRRSSRSS